MKSSDISERLLAIAIDIIRFANSLPGSYAFQIIIKQLIKAVTSAGANYEEAIGAESKADFVHKLQIVLKELRETLYWLKLLLKTDSSKKKEILEKMLKETAELANIIAKSIITAKNKI